MRVVLIWLLWQWSAVCALAQESPHLSQSNLIAQHQLCVLEAFVYNAINTRGIDRNLLDRSVSQCEALLLPLRESIIARTKDSKFADFVLEKIRRASKRGAAVALVGYLGEQK